MVRLGGVGVRTTWNRKKKKAWQKLGRVEACPEDAEGEQQDQNKRELRGM